MKTAFLAALLIVTAMPPLARGQGPAPYRTATQGGSNGTDLKIVSVNYKVIDEGGDDVSISWKVVVRNLTTHELRMMGKVKFLDSDDYVVDTDLFTGYIGGDGQETFTGQTPTGRNEADRVSSVTAEIVDYFRP